MYCLMLLSFDISLQKVFIIKTVEQKEVEPYKFQWMI
jgi:hypothetical protein